MEGIDKVKGSIGKKLGFKDYNTEIPQDIKTDKQENIKSESPKKMKLTIYVSVEAIKKLNEICSRNILEKGKQDKSALIDEAIELLYAHKNGLKDKL
jgi:hypothetical protein